MNLVKQFLLELPKIYLKIEEKCQLWNRANLGLNLACCMRVLYNWIVLKVVSFYYETYSNKFYTDNWSFPLHLWKAIVKWREVLKSIPISYIQASNCEQKLSRHSLLRILMQQENLENWNNHKSG